MKMKFTEYLGKVESGLKAYGAHFDGRFDEIANMWSSGVSPNEVVERYIAPPPPGDNMVQFQIPSHEKTWKLDRVLEEALGTSKPTFIRGDALFYYCTLEQFGLFIILRNRAGISNWIKSLDATVRNRSSH